MTSDRFYEDPASPEGRRSAPAALRNREAIAEVLGDWLPASGLVLELASGTGEHVVHFASRFPRLEWQPSDPDASALASIAAWRTQAGFANLRAPIHIDACDADWPIPHAAAILSINMVHISPWEASLGLLDGAARLLPPGAPLILYGPWIVEGIDTEPSNLSFDLNLKARDPRWGLRSVATFAEEAAARGLSLVDLRDMPANNVMLRFDRQDA